MPEYLHGTVSNVHVWDRALTDEEIAAEYKAQVQANTSAAADALEAISESMPERFKNLAKKAA